MTEKAQESGPERSRDPDESTAEPGAVAESIGRTPSAPDATTASDVIEARLEQGPGAVFRYVSLLTFLLPVVAVYPVVKYRRSDDELADWYRTAPIAGVPGISRSVAVPGLLYGVVFLGIVFGVGHAAVATSGVVTGGQRVVPTSIAYATVLAVGAFTGLGAVFFANDGDSGRDFLQRSVPLLLLAVAFPLVVAPAAGFLAGPGPLAVLASPLARPEYSVLASMAVLYGGLVGHGHVVKSLKIRKELKQRDADAVESRSYVETDRDVGTPTETVDERETIDRFADRTWDAPDDLADRAEPVLTREVVTYRDVTENLAVSAERTTVESPGASASTPPPLEDREAHAPDDFERKSVRRYISGTKSSGACPACEGQGKSTCGSCGGQGATTCGRCNGRGRQQCTSCSGSGVLPIGTPCGNCSGKGHRRCGTCGGQGYTGCGTCKGSGVTTCDRCDATGALTTYEVAELEYRPDTQVSYRSNTVPESVIEDADGEVVEETVTDRPEPGLIRRRETVEEIPVTSCIYRYLDDEWELFLVEDQVKAEDYPRDFDSQFRVVRVATGIVLTVVAGTIGHAAVV